MAQATNFKVATRLSRNVMHSGLIIEGTDADSNILKIYRMLDRDNGDKHYYQVFYLALL